MKNSLLITCFVLQASISSSQSFVEGIIVNEKNQEPIPYVHLGVKNMSLGTISNSEGRFKLITDNLNETDTLQVSHISFKSCFLTLLSLKTKNGKIELSENITPLKEITISAREKDINLLEGIVERTKKSMQLPFTYNLYYREWVKENTSYNRFADGLLTINFPDDKEVIKVQVNQSRAFKLPKDDDEIFDIASPLKMDYLLKNVYVDFLNRFRKLNAAYYDILPLNGSSYDDFYIITIKPKEGAERDASKFLHRAKLKADQDQQLREVEITSDSLSTYEKSLLGLKMKVLESKSNFSFRKIDGRNCLVYARMEFKLMFSFRKKTQTDIYKSEFILLDQTGLTKEIPGKLQYKKSALYKNGNKYTTSFWEGKEIPLLSEEEKNIIDTLTTKSKIKF